MVLRTPTAAWLAAALLLAVAAACPPVACAQAPAAAAPDSTWLDAPLRQAQELYKAEQYAAADSACRALLAEAERRDGGVSKTVADVLAQLVAVLDRNGKGNEPETLQLAERALHVREQIYGPEHVEVAVACIDLANVFASRGEYAQAVQWTERALALREKYLGSDSRKVGDALGNLGVFRYLAGDLKGARPAMERALAIFEKVLGADHSYLSGTLQNLSALCSEMGDPQGALAYAERALGIVEHRAGTESQAYAQALMNVSAAVSETGDLERALELNDRALPILEAKVGPEHVQVLLLRGNRAQQLRRMGRYAEARREIEAILPIAERTLGPQHPNVASMHVELGAQLFALGDYELADLEDAQALAIWERTSGTQSPNYAETLTWRAVNRVESGRVDEGLAMLEQAVRVLEGAGVASRIFAIAVNDLADTQVRAGRLDEAVRNAQRAVAAARASSPREGSQVAMALSTQGIALLDRGDAASARAAHEQALAIRTRELGPQHPETAFSMFQLALTLADQTDDAGALDLALRAEQAGRDHVRLSARALSERGALLYAAKRPRGVDLALAMLARGGLASGDVARVWGEAAQSRGLVLDEMAQRNRLAPIGGDPHLAPLQQELATSRQRLAHLMVSAGERPDAAARVEQAHAAVDRAERALADASAGFRAQLEHDRSELPQWLAQLSPREAVVAYVRYADPLSALAARRAGKPSATGSAAYLAFAQLGLDGAAKAVALGDAVEIDALVSTWRTCMAPAPGGADPRADEDRVRAAGAALRARVWDPVATLVGGATTVLIVPDGELQLVDFAALPIGDDGYLVERDPTLHFLSAERDLLPTAPSTALGLLALGDPDFDRTPQRQGAPVRVRAVAEVALAASSGAPTPFRGQRPGCGDLDAVRWKRLPQTAVELQDIAALWNSGAAGAGSAAAPARRGHAQAAARILSGKAADEASLKALAPGQRALHVATHGFVLGGACGAAGAGARGMGGYVAGRPSTPGAGDAPATPPARALAADNPLQLCGLVLAGANRRASVGPDEEDGIVTAEEIAALDLSSVEWAVLSACETGVGTARAGEGVFGLRRAFHVAGAHTVITSLWQVEDKAAREWMHALYDARWARGLGTADAVRAAARSQLLARRARGASTHPRGWAGFIAAGNWR